MWCFGRQEEAAQHGRASLGRAVPVAASAARNEAHESANGERYWAAEGAEAAPGPVGLSKGAISIALLAIMNP